LRLKNGPGSQGKNREQDQCLSWKRERAGDGDDVGNQKACHGNQNRQPQKERCVCARSFLIRLLMQDVAQRAHGNQQHGNRDGGQVISHEARPQQQRADQRHGSPRLRPNLTGTNPHGKNKKNGSKHGRKDRVEDGGSVRRRVSTAQQSLADDARRAIAELALPVEHHLDTGNVFAKQAGP